MLLQGLETGGIAMEDALQQQVLVEQEVAHNGNQPPAKVQQELEEAQLQATALEQPPPPAETADNAFAVTGSIEGTETTASRRDAEEVSASAAEAAASAVDAATAVAASPAAGPAAGEGGVGVGLAADVASALDGEEEVEEPLQWTEEGSG